MTLRTYSPGDPVEYKPERVWLRGTYVELGTMGDHVIEGVGGLTYAMPSRCLRHPRTKAKPSRPERPRRPTTGAHTARAHSLEAPEGVEQPKPSGPWRSPAYLAYVRTHPCCVCGEINGIHAHHEGVGNGRGMGQKCSDAHTLALCGRCHRERHDHGSPKGVPLHAWGDFSARMMLRLLAAWMERAA